VANCFGGWVHVQGIFGEDIDFAGHFWGFWTWSPCNLGWLVGYVSSEVIYSCRDGDWDWVVK
jgi:hypothetical protein